MSIWSEAKDAYRREVNTRQAARDVRKGDEGSAEDRKAVAGVILQDGPRLWRKDWKKAQ